MGRLMESKLLYKGGCDDCGSSDAKAYYDDGHTHCYSCKITTQPVRQGIKVTEIPKPDKTFRQKILKGAPTSLNHRRILKETCARYGYWTTTYKSEKLELACYRKNNRIVAQKCRTPDKRFSILGDGKDLPLFGSHLYGGGGSKLIITEGEIDCLTVAQMLRKIAVVSLPQGAAGGAKAIRNNYDFVTSYDEVILMLDMDEPGQNAAIEIAEMLPVGMAKIAYLPCKDPNDCLMKGREQDIVSAVFQAKPFRPDGIVSAADIRDDVMAEDVTSDTTYPYSRLNEVTKGLRKGELVTITAGSGIGKSTLVREIAYHLHTNDRRLGMIMLEESTKRTMRGLIGIHLNKNITVDLKAATAEEIERGFDDLVTEDRPIYLYDHFGSSDVDLIVQRIHFMSKALKVEYIILDHISILISGLASNDERKLIDMAMTKLRTAVQELDIGLIVVSHLRRPSDSDKGHEDGAKVRLGQLRGSHAIAQLSDICIGLQVDAEDSDGDHRQINVLKNRFTGEVGAAGLVHYDRNSGRLLDQQPTF